MRQIPCDEVPSPPPPTGHPHAAYWMWAILILAVLLFDTWGWITHNPRLTDVVRHGPKWFRWLMGGFFTWLMIHLFVQKEVTAHESVDPVGAPAVDPRVSQDDPTGDTSGGGCADG